MQKQTAEEKAKNIKLLICDVDGVMTDGSLFYDNNGDEYKAFNSRDGHGIKMLQECGVQVAIITGRTSKLVLHRMHNLNVDMIYQGQADKRHAFRELLEETGMLPEEIAYIGDDVVDLPVMTQVGLAVAVADAHELVLENADWVTLCDGGRGAVRDLCEFIMKAQNHYQNMMNRYL